MHKEIYKFTKSRDAWSDNPKPEDLKYHQGSLTGISPEAPAVPQLKLFDKVLGYKEYQELVGKSCAVPRTEQDYPQDGVRVVVLLGDGN